MPGTTIVTEDHSLSVYAPFDEDGPRAQGGGPVLDRVIRPRAKPITEWSSRNELQIAVSFMFDSFAEGEGVENEQKIRVLEKMRGQDSGDPEPPQLIVTGDPPGCIPNDHHDASHLRWWLEEIQADDDKTLRNIHGNRTRYAGVLIFTEVIQDTPLGNLVATKHQNSNPSKTKRYTVKKGDTLSSIAVKYKVKGGWHTLAKLNNIRDPKKLRIGQVIRLR